ncbi:hypothetical protein I7I53_08890 [Histoplasma capsulatum var. duboisii H88]|uniref:Uncharacterized protein n=1 Tax=Ajellomyces capsulatus (strain H88) TaxID=544711 RepID=A0A8A1L357_AJEC8|nr:hypothetical protein I7I53_08890 [Histoplasma capsulatum var. duboisii H88]
MFNRYFFFFSQGGARLPYALPHFWLLRFILANSLILRTHCLPWESGGHAKFMLPCVEANPVSVLPPAKQHPHIPCFAWGDGVFSLKLAASFMHVDL